MNSLNAELAQFAAAIVQGAAPPSQLQTSQNYTLGAGIEVYRNNYRGNLQEALSGAFPVIEQLVGKDFFRQLARHYIEQFPSRSANLFDYGAQMAEFLATFSPAQTLAYLPDVAALEWACHLAYFADDAEPLDLISLAQVSAEEYAKLGLQIHPACQVVYSRYPVADIWLAHQPQAANDFQIDLESGASIALVSRKNNAVQVSKLNPDAAQWLKSVMTGKRLGEAMSEVLEIHPDFDLQSTLLALVALEVISGFILGETTCNNSAV